MSKVRKALSIYRQSGLAGVADAAAPALLRPIREMYYGRDELRGAIRDHEVTYNGVTVAPYRTLDRFVPLSPPPNKGGHARPAEYESGLCTALRDTVRRGDHVVVLGGGLGVTAAVAALSAGPDGYVTCYEGSKWMSQHVRDTMRRNGLADRVHVINGIIVDGRGVIGTRGDDVRTIPVSDLPSCDVLEMDIEGVETDVLADLSVRPRRVVVETHGNKERIRALLEEREYRIEDEEIAEVGPYRAACERNGVYVLSARRGD